MLASGRRLPQGAIDPRDGVAAEVGHLDGAQGPRRWLGPGPPLRYLVGALELERLRAETKARLGDAFNLRRFHDRILSYGHPPPALVRRAIELGDPQLAPQASPSPKNRRSSEPIAFGFTSCPWPSRVRRSAFGMDAAIASAANSKKGLPPPVATSVGCVILASRPVGG